MRPFWHPLSTILLAEPRCFATGGLLRLMLQAERRVRLIYAGDRMWPALTHGANFSVEAAESTALRVGTAVLACPGGIPDVLRVSAAESGELELAGDADPAPRERLSPGELLGITDLPPRRPPRALALGRRLVLDAREALAGRVDPANDAATTVRDKYESQAPFYARAAEPELEAALRERIRQRVAAGGRILVVGSGAGHECLSLARAGWRVTGLDFARAMVEQAARDAARLGLAVEFELGDVRDWPLAAGSFSAVVFTYDVYSFLPGRAARIRVLERLRAALAPRGLVFLSARRARSSYDRALLVLERAGRGARGGEWGDSHTRWIGADGRLRRSFVHVFTPARLAAEITAAGFELESWAGGHGILVPGAT